MGALGQNTAQVRNLEAVRIGRRDVVRPHAVDGNQQQGAMPGRLAGHLPDCQAA